MTIVWDSDNKRYLYKAPFKKYYKIYSIHLSNNDAISGFLGVVTKPTEEKSTIKYHNKFIGHFSTNVVGNFSRYLEGYKTKYISAGFNNSSNRTCILTIEYEIVDASKPDLIQDFVKRYR